MERNAYTFFRHPAWQNHYSELVGKTPYRMKTIRAAIDLSYRAIVVHVGNCAMIGKTNFIIDPNAIITSIKTILAQEFGRNKTKTKSEKQP